MASNNREARRRKILDRGADRLALITGKIPHLPSSSSSPQPSQQPTDPSTQSHLLSNDQDPVPLLSVPICDGEKASDSMLPQHDAVTTTSLVNEYDGNGREPYFKKCDMNIEDSEAPSVEDRAQPSTDPLTVQSSVITTRTQQRAEPHRKDLGLFTMGQISSAIGASETIRLYCSVSIAVLVVLSIAGIPVSGCNMIKRIIALRPIYLVLLTNLTIVVAKLLLKKPDSSQRAARVQNDTPVNDERGGMELLNKALEVGLLMQKVMNGVLADCSVYSVIVVCGLSLTGHSASNFY